MSGPFQYGVGYVPFDHDPNIIYFDAFSGFPTGPITAIVVYTSAPSPVTVTGYLSYNSDIVTQFNVTSGAIRNDQTPDLVTFYVPFEFTISQVSATARTIVFAWSGLPHPTNSLNLYINDNFFVNVGTDLPTSGQYTAFGLTPDTDYGDCYFVNGTDQSAGIHGITTLNNQFQYDIEFSPSGSSPTQIVFDPFVGDYPSGYNTVIEIYSGNQSATVVGGFDDDLAFACTNPFGSSVDYVIFPSFKISFVSATPTSITFAWVGLPPSLHLSLYLNGSFYDNLANNSPPSGTYTATSLTPNTIYNPCYFTNGIIQTNYISAQTLPPFTIELVDRSNTTLTFAWSGLAQPTNTLYLFLNDGDIFYLVGSDKPASGTFTTQSPYLTPDTRYDTIYFYNADARVGFESTNELDGIQTLDSNFRYGVRYHATDGHTDRIYFEPFTTFPDQDVIIQVLMESDAGTTTSSIGFFSSAEHFEVVDNPYGDGIKYATFTAIPPIAITQGYTDDTTISVSWSGGYTGDTVNLYVNDEYYGTYNNNNT